MFLDGLSVSVSVSRCYRLYLIMCMHPECNLVLDITRSAIEKVTKIKPFSIDGPVIPKARTG